MVPGISLAVSEDEVWRGRRQHPSPPPLLRTCPGNHPPEFPSHPTFSYMASACKESSLYSRSYYCWRRGGWISAVTVWASPHGPYLLNKVHSAIFKPCGNSQTVPTPVLEPIKFMAIFCHFFFCSNRNLNQDGVNRKGRLAPTGNVTCLQGSGLSSYSPLPQGKEQEQSIAVQCLFQAQCESEDPFLMQLVHLHMWLVSQPFCLFAALFDCHAGLPETSCNSENVPLGSPTRCLCGQGTMA